MILEGYWIGLMAQAIAYAVIFISWTIVTGEGGMLWLCQITFAGVGALTTAQLANHYGWPVLAAVVIGGIIAAAMGAIVGFLSIRLGDLYVALVTLTFGLLMENLVFTLPSFVNQGLGLTLNRPEFATLRPGLQLSLPRGLHHHCAVHRELPPLDDGPGVERRPLERGGCADLGHQRRADEGDRRLARRARSPGSAAACWPSRRPRSSRASSPRSPASSGWRSSSPSACVRTPPR